MTGDLPRLRDPRWLPVLQALRPGAPGSAWPVPGPPAGASMMAMQYQFDRTERLPPAALREQQLRQLDMLLRHAVEHVPYYREVLPRAGYDSAQRLTMDMLRRLPVLTRPVLQARRGDLRAATYPAEHGKTGEHRSSGSTGMPISVLKSELCDFLWEAFTLRDHLWHRREMTGTLASIRTRQVKGGSAADGVVSTIWNHGVSSAFRTGQGMMLEGVRTTSERIAWLMRKQPTYLQSSPSMVRELLRALDRQTVRFERLKGVITYSEQVPAGLREEALAKLGVPLTDMYSCREIGYIALQCPERPHYHVMSEGVLVEMLDAQDRPCAPGEVGRVVVTVLHNFAMPLIRYALGDHAEFGVGGDTGGACPCGRTLPVIARILGRTRNMLRLADGDGKWLDLAPFEKLVRDLPVRQYQLVQPALGVVEARMVPVRPLTAAEEARAIETLGAQCGAADCAIRLVYVEAIPRSEGGKYEDFMCLVP